MYFDEVFRTCSLIIMLEQFDQLIINPNVLGGKPCIKDTRISVDIILEWIASGASISGIIQQFPHLSEEGLRQALKYAAHIIKNETLIEVKVA